MLRSLFRQVSQGLVGQAAIYIVAAALNAGIPFLILPLIARWLGPADFGIIGSFVAIVNVLVLLVGLNAYGFVSVGYFRDGADTLPRLVGAGVIIIATAASVVGAFGWIGAAAIERLTQIDRSWLWTLLAAATGQAVIALGLAVAQTIKRPVVYGIVQIGYGLSLATLALILVGAFGMGWPGRALAQAVAASVAAAGVLIWLRASKRLRFIVGREMIDRALRFGVPLLPHSLAAVAMGSMDRMALSGDYPADVVGHYFLALQLSSIFTAIAAAVNQAWVPWLYERLARNDIVGWVQIGRAIRIGGGLLAASAVGMALLAPWIVAVVGGAEFEPAVMPLRILAFYAALQAWYMLLSAFLFYGNRTRLLSMLTVLTALMQGGLIILLLPMGATGVATALVLSAFAAAALMSFVVRRSVVAQKSATAKAALP